MADVHAEPDDTAMGGSEADAAIGCTEPFSPMSSDSPSTNAKLTFRLPGRRCVGWPFR